MNIKTTTTKPIRVKIATERPPFPRVQTRPRQNLGWIEK